ncbi:c-type cytochrome [Novosphingobium profundi]|nr:c-type cytochrome [Novosphingobium profundi]
MVETPDAQAGSASEAVRAQPSPEPSATATTAPPPPAAKPAPEPAPAPAPVTPAAAAGPPAAFARCAVCHNAEKGAADKLGPNLYGIFGHKMGQGSFAFSEAVKNSGLTMDEATLDAWLENPRALVPGNRMSFPGLKDAGKRQEIIAYLKQQR